jgi:hypothetical protein
MKLREKFDIFAKLISIPEFEVSSCSAGLFKLLFKFPQKSKFNKEYNSYGSCSAFVSLPFGKLVPHFVARGLVALCSCLLFLVLSLVSLGRSSLPASERRLKGKGRGKRGGVAPCHVSSFLSKGNSLKRTITVEIVCFNFFISMLENSCNPKIRYKIVKLCKSGHFLFCLRF